MRGAGERAGGGQARGRPAEAYGMREKAGTHNCQPHYGAIQHDGEASHGAESKRFASVCVCVYECENVCERRCEYVSV